MAEAEDEESRENKEGRVNDILNRFQMTVDDEGEEELRDDRINLLKTSTFEFEKDVADTEGKWHDLVVLHERLVKTNEALKRKLSNTEKERDAYKLAFTELQKLNEPAQSTNNDYRIE
jgi:hypothetical protein